MESARLTSSFRDPSGYVYKDGDNVRRVVNPIYYAQYNALNSTGFYKLLFEKRYLIPHTEIAADDTKIILQPENIPFFSYPYEWSFLQYKHAALLTLKLQKFCLQHNFTLKDASAFNVTFHNGKPLFIDTLSFDFYADGTPWKAYRQFIMHFLGPLVLTKYHGHHFLKTLAADIDGIPLARLSKLLPAKTYLNPTLLTNVHLLAKYDRKYSGSDTPKKQSLSKSAQIRLLDSLYDYVKNLQMSEQTEWAGYYSQTNYNDIAHQIKKELTAKWYGSFAGDSVIDIGGNDGTFTRELPKNLKFGIVADVDPNAVEQNYRKTIAQKEANILPIVADVLNPAAGYGFNNAERFPLIDRLAALKLDGCLALAVIHHITLSGNIPFALSAEFFAKLASHLLIEFPGRNDSWVRFLLDGKRESREDFGFYNEDEFEAAYSKWFEIVKKDAIPESNRTLYTMVRRANS
ncbi:MAG TPA: class I SAM-dependent methyltransferase [Flavobacterium sp.]|jgi:hypothetical protein